LSIYLLGLSIDYTLLRVVETLPSWASNRSLQDRATQRRTP